MDVTPIRGPKHVSQIAAAAWTLMFDGDSSGRDDRVPRRLASRRSVEPLATIPESVVGRIRAGDETALKEIVDTLGSNLVDFVTNLVRSHDAAQDIVQDVLYGMWRQGDQFAPKGSLAAYLFSAVRNRALNALAHEHVVTRARPLIADALITEADRNAAPSIEEAEEWERQVVALRHAIATLTEHQRTALDLRYNRGLTIPEIAHVLNVSPKGVERLMTRVRKLLRDQVLGTDV